jgi:1-acyl-sn-glycerol-3-phosphate acyltransferase
MRLPLAIALAIGNMLIWSSLFYLFLPIKFLPFTATKRLSQRLIAFVGANWITGNEHIARLLYGINVEVSGLDHPEIGMDKSFAIMCNHRSYSDIFFLQTALNRRIPLLKFFIKDQLIWFPVMGPIWWAMDYPFVKRHTREEIKKNPKLEKQDELTIKRACDKYRLLPISLLNFLEGHRRTPERMAKLGDKNPYHYLLPPKSGGFSMALSALKDTLHGVLDITIVYPGDRITFKELFAGKVRRVLVNIEFIPIAEVPIEPDFDQAKKSTAVRDWVNRRWARKDEQIAKTLEENPG